MRIFQIYVTFEQNYANSMYVFDINPTGDPFTDDPRLLAIPEFKALQNFPDAMAFVVFTVDYLSPYRHMPEDKKRELVIKERMKGEIGILETPLVRDAIAMYKQLQYHPILEANEVNKQKLYELNVLLKDTKPDISNFNSIQKIMVEQDKIVTIAEKAEKRASQLFTDLNESRVKGGHQRSHIEDNIFKIQAEIKGKGQKYG